MPIARQNDRISLTSLLNWFKLVYFLNILEAAAQVSSKAEAMRVGAMSIIQHSDLQKRRIKSPKSTVRWRLLYVRSLRRPRSLLRYVRTFVRRRVVELVDRRHQGALFWPF